MDDVQDCEDGSDECPSNQEDIFSSNFHLIGNEAYRTILWIAAVIAFFANGVSAFALYELCC